jgi:ABC-type antimicrobial peptide transport system permease subunit
LDLAIGASLRVDLPFVGYQSFTVAGYFGPEPANLGGMGWAYWVAEPTWSYISQERLSELVPAVSPTGYILVSLTSPVVNDAVVAAIEALNDVASVESSLDVLEEFNTDVFLNSVVNMMQMGLLFAFLLASLGTAVVVYLTLRERRRSTALMSARGMTYMQTVRVLMAESLTMMGFSILIGLLVGFIVLYGLVQSGSFGYLVYPALLVPRFLPPTFLTTIILQLGAVVGLLLLATIIPILIESYTARYDLSILR